MIVCLLGTNAYLHVCLSIWCVGMGCVCPLVCVCACALITQGQVWTCPELKMTKWVSPQTLFSFSSPLFISSSVCLSLTEPDEKPEVHIRFWPISFCMQLDFKNGRWIGSTFTLTKEHQLDIYVYCIAKRFQLWIYVKIKSTVCKIDSQPTVLSVIQQYKSPHAEYIASVCFW